MAKQLLLILCCSMACLFSELYAQDAYHQTLLTQLQNDYGLSGGTFVMAANENTNVNSYIIYGNQSNSITPITGQDFSLANNVIINAAGANPWDSGASTQNTERVMRNDVVLLVCWLRSVSPTTANSFVNLFAENLADYSKEAFAQVSLSNEWLQYLIPFQATQTYNAGEMNIGLHLAFDAQQIEFGGYNLVNFDNNHALEDLPLDLHNELYGGHEADAPWRAQAVARIEQYRKADLTIEVVDQSGNPISGAQVTVDMDQHLYGFGSAIATTRLAGNSNQDMTYQNKILDMDGQGHGFNTLVNENSLKWRAWEQGWAGTKAESVNAIQWATQNNITMRGHNGIWPGVSFLPPDIVTAIDNLDLPYIKTRIFDHIDEKFGYPGIEGVILDWDIINEFTQNEDIANAFQTDPNYTTGREIYTEIINKVRTDYPNVKQYINDYVTLSFGNNSSSAYTTYKQYIQEQFDANAGFDGIGFQAHIGSSPTSIYMVYDILEDFYQSFGVEAKITEYDLDAQVDDITAGNYLRDFLTMCFSHPSTNAFLTWGFWDGAHWKGNAPFYNLDWTIKPAGQQFIELVFGEWWTNETTNTNILGSSVVSVFKGQHTVTAAYDGQVVQANIDVNQDGSITLQLPIDLCPAILDLDMPHPSGIYSAGQQVRASTMIDGSKDVSYVAGNNVLLDIGFSVDLGASFNAYIGSCN